jgi:hypothetical protein
MNVKGHQSQLVDDPFRIIFVLIFAFLILPKSTFKACILSRRGFRSSSRLPNKIFLAIYVQLIQNIKSTIKKSKQQLSITFSVQLLPKLSDFLLDLHQFLAHQGFAKILDISTGMPVVFANPYASRSQHISPQKIAQLRYYKHKI